MYPVLLEAPLKDYIWGGTRLKNEYGFDTELEKVSEAWVLSCHKDGESIIENGDMAGKTLTEALSVWGKEALGERASAFPYFPILIKLIDACDRLSLQVHPDDEYAMRVEGEYGKTEMWYVVDCDEGASLIYGLTKTIDKAEFERRIRDNTIEEVCNFVPVKKGDVFFIPAGTLHAIGKGILIAEVQQNSNTTYRVSDYGRLGADGKPRALHVEKAIDVTKTEPPTVPYGAVGEIRKEGDANIRTLAECPLFTAEHLSLSGKYTVSSDGFVSAVVLSGKLIAEWENGTVEMVKGQSLFIPADVKTVFSGEGELLLSKV